MPYISHLPDYITRPAAHAETGLTVGQPRAMILRYVATPIQHEMDPGQGLSIIYLLPTQSAHGADVRRWRQQPQVRLWRIEAPADGVGRTALGSTHFLGLAAIERPGDNSPLSLTSPYPYHLSVQPPN